MAATDASQDMINCQRIAARWESWYAGQDMINCQRCDRPMPNLHGRDYCSKDCELGNVKLPYQDTGLPPIGSVAFRAYKPGSWRDDCPHERKG